MPGTSLAVQWLRLCPSSAGGMGSIPVKGAKIPHAVWCGKKKKVHLVYVNYSVSLKTFFQLKKP